MDFARAYDPIRALEASWELLKKSPLPLLVGGIVLMFTDGHGGSGGDFKGKGHASEFSANAGEILAVLGIVGCCVCVVLLIHAWISLGMANVVEKTRNEGRAGFRDLFDARGRFFEMVLGHILMILVYLGATVPFILIVLGAWFAHEELRAEHAWVVAVAVIAALAWLPVWIWLLLGVSLYRPAIAIEGLGPTAAIGRSWQLVRGHRLRLLLYWIAISIFSMLGLCLCCVGVFLTGPMAQIAQFESYLELVQPKAGYGLSAAPVEPPPPPSPAV